MLSSFKHFFKSFDLSLSEQRGLLVFSALLFSFLLVKAFHSATKEIPPLDQEYLAQSNYQKKETKFSSKETQIRPQYIPPAYMRKNFEVDINRADSMDFCQLRGIGPVYAKRIVEYRKKLGGFIRKTQLKEVWGIDSVLYESIENRLVLKSISLEKIDINVVDIPTLKQHPYVDYYLAKEIVLFREKNGRFKNLSDLLSLSLIDKETYLRLKDYLYCGGLSEEP